jgi:hypothetical protein
VSEPTPAEEGDNSQAEQAHDEPSAKRLSPKEFATTLESFEISWWNNMLTDSESVAIPESEVTPVLQQLEPAPSWSQVSLLRLSGQIKAARAVAMKLSQEGADYASATLDLVESEDPPWALLAERYKSASMGEAPPYLARVGLIYSLASSHQLDAARADYHALAKIPGAADSPLFAPLGLWLQQQGEVKDQEPAQPPPQESVKSTAAKAPSEKAATEKAATEKAPAEKAATEKAPAEKVVTPAIRSKVDQADTLWRSGGREQAVVLYRQVVSELGTSHFLGQRAAARVAQAQREKSEGKGSP